MAINKAETKRGVQTGSLGPGAAGRGLATGGLRTARDIASERLMDLAGKKKFNVDPLQAGGFANRDRIAQQVRSASQDEKRRKRIVNHAYRQALRSGDRIKAMEVLAFGEKNLGVTSFGGVRPAGQTEAGVMQRQGEDFITAVQRQQGGAGNPIAAAAGIPFEGVEQEQIDGAEQEQKNFVPKGFLGSKGGFGERGSEPASLVNKYDNSPPPASLLRREGADSGMGPVASEESARFSEDQELEGLMKFRPKQGSEDEELRSLQDIQSQDVVTLELARRKRNLEAEKAKNTKEVIAAELARREGKRIRAGQVQKVGKFEPFTAEAMRLQKEKGSGVGRSMQDQTRFLSNATSGLGRGIRNQEFSKIRQETQKEMLGGRLNAGFAARYLKDVADVFRDYERMKGFGVSDSVPAPPSSEERASNQRALFDWVSKVKEQKLLLGREERASQSEFNKMFSR